MHGCDMVPSQELKTEADKIREDVFENLFQELLDLGLDEEDARCQAEDEADDAVQSYWISQAA